MVDIAVCFRDPRRLCTTTHVLFSAAESCMSRYGIRTLVTMSGAATYACLSAALRTAVSGRGCLSLSSSLWPLDHIRRHPGGRLGPRRAFHLCSRVVFSSAISRPRQQSPWPPPSPLGLLQRRLPPLQRRLPPADDHSCGPTRSPATPLVANEGKPR